MSLNTYRSAIQPVYEGQLAGIVEAKLRPLSGKYDFKIVLGLIAVQCVGERLAKATNYCIVNTNKTTFRLCSEVSSNIFNCVDEITNKPICYVIKSLFNICIDLF